MARRPRIFAPGLLYHVIVRGNQRRTTFRSDDDYTAYFDRLAIYRAKFSLGIYGYCLMPTLKKVARALGAEIEIKLSA